MKTKYGKPWWANCLAVTLVLALMLVLMPTVTAQAAPADTAVTESTEGTDVEDTAVKTATKLDKETVLALKSIFSLDYYVKCNPDVLQVFGYNEAAIFQHFLDYGLEEGRVVSPIVNLQAYRDASPDLVEVYGDDWKGLAGHFVTYGIYETANGDRPSNGVLFNPVTYLREHPEAELTTGGDVLKAAELFIDEGMPAGEWADETIVAVMRAESYEEVQNILTEAEVSRDVEDNWKLEATEGNGGNSSTITTPSEPTITPPQLIDPPVLPETPDVPDGSDEPEVPEVPEPPVIPDPPEPVCGEDHAVLRCGEACGSCDYVAPDHEYESGYCVKCGISRVQATCQHNFVNGTCVKGGNTQGCGFHDPNYVNHEHEYGDDGYCKLCKERNPELPPEEVEGEPEVVPPTPQEPIPTVSGGDAIAA